MPDHEPQPPSTFPRGYGLALVVLVFVLDLNLPKKDGRQVLEEMKADRALSTIPVVVLTTSEAEEDVLRSYELHANAYVTKPLDFSRFNEIVQRIDEFWFTIVRLPGDQQRPE